MKYSNNILNRYTFVLNHVNKVDLSHCKKNKNLKST